MVRSSLRAQLIPEVSADIPWLLCPTHLWAGGCETKTKMPGGGVQAASPLREQVRVEGMARTLSVICPTEGQWRRDTGCKGLATL